MLSDMGERQRCGLSLFRLSAWWRPREAVSAEYFSGESDAVEFASLVGIVEQFDALAADRVFGVDGGRMRFLRSGAEDRYSQ